MDASEELAKKYLEHIGSTSIEYEPDGNVPPDFVVNKRIAVEVRRLNQNEPARGGFRGLEETEIPLRERIRTLLTSFGPSKSGVSWFVFYTFRRPLPPWKELRSALSSHLRSFVMDEREKSFKVDDAFDIQFLRSSGPHPTLFLLGGYDDDDSGGWVLEETRNNLRLCIDEKTLKIARFRNRYPEWWLVLVDRIGYGVDECDRALYREQLRVKHTWDKIILLNPTDYRSAFEI